MNQTLFDYYGEHTTDGVPLLNPAEFKYITDTYGKVECRETLAEYICTKRSKFPLVPIEHEDMCKSFNKLQRVRYEQYLTPASDQQRIDVIEKYPDYNYPYRKYGLGIVDCPSSPYNRASDYFMRPLRFRCNGFAHEGPIKVWEEGTYKQIWGVLGAMWRGINQVHYNEHGECISGAITVTSYSLVFRLGSYIATQFKPIVARSVYEMTGAKRVLDTSMGWGDRLCGFFASSSTTSFIGCDPNPSTFIQYKNMIMEYSHRINNDAVMVIDDDNEFQIHGNKKCVHIYRLGAEDLPWDDINDIDCAFTSPPYFSTEMYNQGGLHEEDQSWSKYSEYDSWQNDFFLPVAMSSWESLSTNGFLVHNIMDPKIKGHRYYTSDALIDHIGNEHFIGQFGMRIQQRPQGRNTFETKEELKTFLNKTYIENVWCFRKDDSNHLNLFRDAIVPTLDEFF